MLARQRSGVTASRTVRRYFRRRGRLQSPTFAKSEVCSVRAWHFGTGHWSIGVVRHGFGDKVPRPAWSGSRSWHRNCYAVLLLGTARLIAVLNKLMPPGPLVENWGLVRNSPLTNSPRRCRQRQSWSLDSAVRSYCMYDPRCPYQVSSGNFLSFPQSTLLPIPHGI